MEDKNKQAINNRKKRIKRMFFFGLPILFAFGSASYFGVTLWMDVPWWGILIGYLICILAFLVGTIIAWKIVKQTYFSIDDNEKSK